MEKALYDQLVESARQCRNREILKKIDLFLKVLQLGNVLKACREQGTYSRYYYYWWKRYRDSGFQIEALEEKSRRPKRIHRQTDARAIEWILHYREKEGLTLEQIQLSLLKKQKIRVSLSTIYRVVLKKTSHLKKVRKKIASSSRGQDPLRQLSDQLHAKILQPEFREDPKQLYRLLQSFLKVPRKKGTGSPMADLSLPQTVLPTWMIGDRYQVERELGSGGGGTVYLVEDQKNREKKLALKVLELKAGQDLVLLESLKNEFKTLSSLHHSNLAQVFDFGMTAKEMYFTSEWIEGVDILKAAEPANLNTVFQLILQALKSLDYLHRRGVLHLDLKPSNILVTDPDRTGEINVKLIDFGGALLRKKGAFTRSEFVGTPPYTAPEIILEKTPSPASDIYSLGMLLHQIFARRFPFESQDPLSMMQTQVYQQPLRMTEINPALPEDFSDLLLKMVARNPEDRFQSALEVLEAINRCLGENFSLRSSLAPVRILEESDHLFRGNLLEELVEIFLKPQPQVTVLSGGAGMGKSRLIKRVKERLQLQGVYPLFFEDSESLEEFLKSKQQGTGSPLFIDLKEDSRSDFSVFLDSLENTGLPVLVTTRNHPSSETNPNLWMTLPPLSLGEIQEFLQNEICDFPLISQAEGVTTLSKGSPQNFETVLQAMREEGLIQWSDRGWRWVAGEEATLSSLLNSHEARWKDRLKRLQEILKFSQMGLNAKTLEGILNLEPSCLDEKLPAWVHTGEISSRKVKKTILYFSKGVAPSLSIATFSKDWTWVEKELDHLYRIGAYNSGVQWAELLSSKIQNKAEIPPKVALLCARHWVAAGFAKKSSAALPASPPQDPHDRGLFFEIQTRIQLTLGALHDAKVPLKEAQDSYGSCHDVAGLSRVLNLHGSLFKRLNDLSAAETSFKESIRAAQQIQDPHLEGLTQMNLATIYHDQGQFDRAEQVYNQAFRLDAKTPHPLLTTKLRQNWVNLLFYTGRIQEAESACYELLKSALHYGYLDQQAASFNYLALISAQRGQRELQLNYLNQALGVLNPDRFPQLYSQILISRGYLYWDLKKFLPAQIDGEQTLQIVEEHPNSSLYCVASLLLGKTLRDRVKPDFTAATQYLNNAHQMILKTQYRQLLWEVEFERGLLAKRKNEILRAKNYFLSAQTHLETLLQELPEPLKQSYLRDRKLERISSELQSLTTLSSGGCF